MALGSCAGATCSPFQGQHEGTEVRGARVVAAAPRFQLSLSLQTPEQPRHVVATETLRSRASSPRRAGPAGDGRFHLPPRIHRASDPGLPGRGALVQRGQHGGRMVGGWCAAQGQVWGRGRAAPLTLALCPVQRSRGWEPCTARAPEAPVMWG